MRTTVTAILVAENGGTWLTETLEALAAQTLAPDRLIGVVNGNNPEVAEILKQAGCETVAVTGTRVAFGKAIAAAEKLLTADEDEELLWLLTEDSAPDAGALNYLFRKIVGSPSVAAVGPKLLDWDNPSQIIELGQGMTKHGSRWLLKRQELDQQQYDSLEDVLGVGPYGMLVRRSVWRKLDGFDPALPVWDDGLDFSVRARLAGHRIVVAPKARIRVAQLGIAGPEIARSRGKMRTAYRKARTAHLHRQLAYTPAVALPLYWLMLPFIGLFRVFWVLMREQPGNMLGEFIAALIVFFNPGKIIASRDRIKRVNKVGWSAIRPLQVENSEIRTQRLADREAILADRGIIRKEIGFIANGGLSVLLISTVIGIVFTWWLYADGGLQRGGVIPLSNFGELWENTRMRGGVPADPFTWVLALIGTVTFWNPSLALVGLIALAIPMSALGGWFWGSMFSDRSSGRMLAGFAWALSPVALGALAQGWIPTLLLTISLPWLLFAAAKARESWSWAGITSLLSLVCLAASPVLLPVAIVLWILSIIFQIKSVPKILAVAIAPAVLFTPNLLYAITVGDLFAILRDPGAVTPYHPATLWQMFLSFPQEGLAGWAEFLSHVGLQGISPTLIVGLMVVPLGVLGICGLYTGKALVSVYSALLGGLGIATAVFASHTALVYSGNSPVYLWTGSGLALYWIAIVTLAASGVDILRKVGTVVVAVAVVCGVIAVTPTAVQLITGKSAVRESAQQLPEIVRASGAVDKDLQTLVLTPLSNGAIRAEIIRGAGRNLDDIRALKYTENISAEEDKIAGVTADLISAGSPNLKKMLIDTGVDYVLIAKSADNANRTRIQAVLDEQGSLHSVGLTPVGLLWSVDDEIRKQGSNNLVGTKNLADLPLALKVTNSEITSQTLWILQLVILVGMILLALPTGEPQARPPKRKKQRKTDETSPIPVVAGDGAKGIAASEISEAAAQVAKFGATKRIFKAAEPEFSDTEQKGEERE